MDRSAVPPERATEGPLPQRRRFPPVGGQQGLSTRRTGPFRGGLTQAEEDRLRQEMQAAARNVGKSKKDIADTKKAILTYEQAFQQLREASGIQSVSKIVDR